MHSKIVQTYSFTIINKEKDIYNAWQQVLCSGYEIITVEI